MRSHWTTDQEIDSLETRGSWATLAELKTVIPYHSQRYKTVLQECKNNLRLPLRISQLARGSSSC